MGNILQRRIFWKKEELKLKKIEMNIFKFLCKIATASQSAFTCSKLTIETLEQGVKFVQS